jgi:hypothetical protein
MNTKLTLTLLALVVLISLTSCQLKSTAIPKQTLIGLTLEEAIFRLAE